MGRGVLAGLRAAHAVDIQHRDIKPANVLLRPDGRPVLTDFGIAAIQGSTALTIAGSFIGTPDYMAPERVGGDDGDSAADLWSLALMLYVAVEGHHPLRRANTLATLAAVLSEDVPPPRRAGPLTAALTAVLVRDPAARPDAEALDGLLEAEWDRGGGDVYPIDSAPTSTFRLATPGRPPRPRLNRPGRGTPSTYLGRPLAPAAVSLAKAPPGVCGGLRGRATRWGAAVDLPSGRRGFDREGQAPPLHQPVGGGEPATESPAAPRITIGVKSDSLALVSRLRRAASRALTWTWRPISPVNSAMNPRTSVEGGQQPRS